MSLMNEFDEELPFYDKAEIEFGICKVEENIECTVCAKLSDYFSEKNESGTNVPFPIFLKCKKSVLFFIRQFTNLLNQMELKFRNPKKKSLTLQMI